MPNGAKGPADATAAAAYHEKMQQKSRFLINALLEISVGQRFLRWVPALRPQTQNGHRCLQLARNPPPLRGGVRGGVKI